MDSTHHHDIKYWQERTEVPTERVQIRSSMNSMWEMLYELVRTMIKTADQSVAWQKQLLATLPPPSGFAALNAPAAAAALTAEERQNMRRQFVQSIALGKTLYRENGMGLEPGWIHQSQVAVDDAIKRFVNEGLEFFDDCRGPGRRFSVWLNKHDAAKLRAYLQKLQSESKLDRVDFRFGAAPLLFPDGERRPAFGAGNLFGDLASLQSISAVSWPGEKIKLLECEVS